MDILDKIRLGLNIFAELSPEASDRSIAVEHDIIYAGPDPSIVSDEKQAELAELGWGIEEEFDCFYHFV